MWQFQTCASIFVFLVPIFVIGQTDVEKKKLCGNFKVFMVHQQLDGEQNCTKMLNLTDPMERLEKLDCVLKCILYQQHVINEQGFIDKDRVDKYSIVVTPEFFRKEMIDLIHECMDHYAAQLDPKELLCKSYDGMAKCIQHVLMKQMCPPPNTIVPKYHGLL